MSGSLSIRLLFAFILKVFWGFILSFAFFFLVNLSTCHKCVSLCFLPHCVNRSVLSVVQQSFSMSLLQYDSLDCDANFAVCDFPVWSLLLNSICLIPTLHFGPDLLDCDKFGRQIFVVVYYGLNSPEILKFPSNRGLLAEINNKQTPPKRQKRCIA